MSFPKSAAILGLAASLATMATAAKPEAQPELKGLEAKVDSLAKELSTLEKILTNKGLNVERERQSLARQDSVYNIPFQGTAILGDPKAPVSLVLFTDLQCPYCAQMLPIVKQLVASHPKSLKVSFRHFPLVSIHDKAMTGHLALWAAGNQGRLWDYYFKVAPSFHALTDSALVTAAKELKFDLKKFDTDRKSEAAHKAVEADMKLGEEIGVEGTPSLYLNGKPTRNPGEIDAYATKVEAEQK